ncbi:MAG TPA: hypothetical protein VM621_01960 [Luteibacter sp.]|uniref:hypothetical protein n=1 Tax=Luteibacter sp. TaxID=1886636 RepID=UPI002BB4AF74|nr:hypothetical protein [Luteibacter sp.]HVI53800.1 hypothetical protein [Luteibacter sp.]
MKNVQIVDSARNATYEIFAAEDEQFAVLFPHDADIEFVDDAIDRMGQGAVDAALEALWSRPIDKQSAEGVHGTLIYGLPAKRAYFPSKRSTEFDRVDTPGFRWLRRSAKGVKAGKRGRYFHVQVMDDRPESDYPVFAVTASELDLIFPFAADMEFEGDLVNRLGWLRGHKLLFRIFGRRVPKSTVEGIDGTIYRGNDSKREVFPTKRSHEELSLAECRRAMAETVLKFRMLEDALSIARSPFRKRLPC